MLVQIAVIRDDRLGSNFFILRSPCPSSRMKTVRIQMKNCALNIWNNWKKKQKIESVVVLIVTELN